MSPMKDRFRVDHVCGACGAQAVVVAGVVMVPHQLGCPVAVRVAELRARALVAT